MNKRHFLIFLSLIFFGFGAQAQSIFGYEYLRHEFKIWLWDDAFQVQIIHLQTKSMANVFVRYNVEDSKMNRKEKYRILELEVETLAKTGAVLHDSIKILEEDPFVVEVALRSLFLMNVSAINFYGPRDFNFDYETVNVPEPVFLLNEPRDADFFTQFPAPLLKEVDIYRFHKLFKKVLSPENVAYLNQTMKSDESLTCSGYLK